MDPTECLQNIICAICCNDRETARVGLQDLGEWIARGGVLPVIEILGPADLRKPDPDRVRVAI